LAGEQRDGAVNLYEFEASPDGRAERPFQSSLRLINLMGPEFVREFGMIMTSIGTDEHLNVVVFGRAVEGFFLDHSDFLARREDLTSLPKRRSPTSSCV
jgi:hypothetical protein